jgi:hypothetical protein
MNSEADRPSCYIVLTFPLTRIKVTLVARPLLTPVAHKVRGCVHGVFTNRTCTHFQTLLRIDVIMLLLVKHSTEQTSANTDPETNQKVERNMLKIMVAYLQEGGENFQYLL